MNKWLEAYTTGTRTILIRIRLQTTDNYEVESFVLWLFRRYDGPKSLDS